MLAATAFWGDLVAHDSKMKILSQNFGSKGNGPAYRKIHCTVIFKKRKMSHSSSFTKVGARLNLKQL